MRKFSLLFAPDAPDSPGTPTTETPAAPAATPAAGTPPPAAAAVIGGRTENEANLEKELEEERNKRKKAETDASYFQNEVRTLKQQQQPTEPPQGKRSSGWVFPDEEEKI